MTHFNEKYRLLFEYSSDAHLILDETGLIDCNDAAIRLLECRDKEEVLSIHPAELSPEFQPDGLHSMTKAREMDSLAAKNGFHHFEWVHKKKSGEEFPVAVTLNSIQLDGKPAIIAVWHDLTHIKRAEHVMRTLINELDQKSAALEKMNQRLVSELSQAAQLQKSLLPKETLDLDRFRAAWAYRPCMELGGDILNIFRIDNENVGLYILDVTGHGVPASLTSVTASHFLSPLSDYSLIRKMSHQTDVPPIVSCPNDVAFRLNEHFSTDSNSTQFLTLFYGIFNLKSLGFAFTSAGHPGPVLISQTKGASHIKIEGYPIGIMRGLAYDNSFLQTEPGDRLYFFSDGIYEAQNKKGEEFGLDRIERFLAERRNDTLQGSIDALIEEVDRWSRPLPQADDISLLAFEVK